MNKRVTRDLEGNIPKLIGSSLLSIRFKLTSKFKLVCCIFSISKSELGMPGHAALEGNHMACLALLLRHGADLETKNHNQETLLQCIMKKCGQARTDKLLKESGNKWEG